MAKSSGNSEDFMRNAVSSNPQYQQIYQEMEQQGGSLKEVFMKRAKELGIDTSQLSGIM